MNHKPRTKDIRSDNQDSGLERTPGGDPHIPETSLL